jgi:hypothetical protein
VNKIIASELKDGLIFELDNLIAEPQAIVMSPEFHKAIEKPSGIRGVNIVVDARSERHWRLKF